MAKGIATESTTAAEGRQGGRGGRLTGGRLAGRPLVGTVAACWALLFGMGLVMLGNGLQASLLGLRANLEGFPTFVTGIVMSGYFVGFVLGSQVTPRLLRRVGHIRVFAALASLASSAVLLHPLLPEPVAWGVMRIVTGFAYAGLYIVAESWLNDQTTNATRGRMLSIYMVISLGGMATGPLLLNLASPGDFDLFIAISVLVSLSLVPILLTVQPAPRFDTPSKIGVREIYRASPLAVFGCLFIGASTGTLMGFGAVYAENIGLSVAEVSLFMSLGTFGGMLLQWPIGQLSDTVDRRLVLAAVTILAAVAALASFLLPAAPHWPLLGLVALFGGLTFPIYSLSLAHANDRLEPEQMVGASSALILINGTGAILGPSLAGLLMESFGPQGFFGYLAVLHALLGVVVVYRIVRRPAAPAGERGSYVYVSRTSAVATAAAYETSHEEQAGEEEAPESTLGAAEAREPAAGT